MASPRRARFHAAVLALVVVAAASSHGVAIADKAASNATAPTTLEPWMTCMRVNSVGDVCDVQSVCTRCVHTPGCAFDALVRECTTLPDGGRAMYASSSNALLNRTNLHYCADSDPRCAACQVSSSNPFCEGADGSCVCPSMCVALRSSQLSCYALRQSNMMYISLAAMAVAVPVLVWLQRFFARMRRGGSVNASDVRAELRRMREQRLLDQARERQRQRPASALALQLDTWRSHRDEHRVEIDKVEPLKSCYVLMESNEASATASRSTGTSSAESSVVGPAGDHRREETDDVATSNTTETSRGATTAL